MAKLLKEPEIDRTPKPDGSEFADRTRGLAASFPPNVLSDEAMHLGTLQFFEAGPHYLYGHIAIFRYDLADALKSVTAPTMVIDFPGKLTRGEVPIAKALRPDFVYKNLSFGGLMADFDDLEPWCALVAAYVKGDTTK